MTQWRVALFEELGSTSDFCVAKAKAGEAEGLAVMARRQTAGRGSRGREWQAPEGNLNLSVLLRPGVPAADSGMFPLLAGVAVYEALKTFLPAEVVLRLKWPNDVLVGQAKIAGILIDASPVDGQLDWLVIGIGINLLAAPAIPGRAVTSLSDQGGRAASAQAADAVLGQLAHWLAMLQSAGGAAIRKAWLRRAHPVGTTVAVNASHGKIDGIFAGLSSHGALLLARDGKIERIDTGEILLAEAG